MELAIKKMVTVHAKTLKIHIKVCDQFTALLVDQDGALLKQYEGYVPGFMPGPNYGDYVMLDIDIDTGVVMNWKQIKPAQIQEFIDGE